MDPNIFLAWQNKEMSPPNRHPSGTLVLLLLIGYLPVNDGYSQSPQDRSGWPARSSTIVDHSVAPVDYHSESRSVPPPSAPRSLTAKQPAFDSSANRDPQPDWESANSTSSINWIQQLQTQAEQIQLGKVLSSLAIVLGGYFGFVWLTRKISPSGSHHLPREVLEILGQTPYGPRKSLQLVRLGSKLLLLLNGPEGTHTIGEITDPHEVEYLSSVCGGKNHGRGPIAIRKASVASSPNSARSDLKRVLQQLQGPNSDNQPSVFEA